jgi:hypothetical protein
MNSLNMFATRKKKVIADSANFVKSFCIKALEAISQIQLA